MLPATAVTRIANIREVGWPRNPNEVFIGRPSPWGNPFIIGKHGDRDTVIQMYRDYLAANPSLLAQLPTLAGKTLYCFCAPQRCHGDILIEELKKRHPELA